MTTLNITLVHDYNTENLCDEYAIAIRHDAVAQGRWFPDYLDAVLDAIHRCREAFGTSGTMRVVKAYSLAPTQAGQDFEDNAAQIHHTACEAITAWMDSNIYDEDGEIAYERMLDNMASEQTRIDEIGYASCNR